ncbi:MAG: ferredoxin family protein [Candidatus Bathyarchaeota archaeon]|nr:ferredoxin family protein [Candidatus Bathyarchaeota archaeon]
MSENTFHGVPRSNIPWYPTINYEKCLSCGKCVKYCKHDVYGFEEKQGKKVPFVKNADNCIVYCNGCDAICASGAISHPSKMETGRIISKLRKEAE